MVSSKDVAKLANVSQTTVSRVLNSPELVRPKTVEKVMKAIKELNYHPDPVARSLVSKQTKTIALISGPLYNPFFVDTTSAIVDYANEKDYQVIVHFSNDDKEDITNRYIFKNKVDGIIMSSILMDDPIYEQMKCLDIPIIFFNRRHSKECNFVEIDNEMAGFLLTEHLIQKGHKEIVWISGQLDKSTFHDRYKGYERALKTYNYPMKKENMFIIDTDPNTIKSVFKKIISREKKITAIAASTDAIALLLLDLYGKLNVKVPEEVAIIGIDNVDLSSLGYVQLSTVGPSESYNLGRVAIEKLFDLIEKKTDKVQITAPVQLYERKTT
ncbi:transcriptional regulator [Ureibacillus massiliensis 4400831 = CIP 108448 = CCUG 49529]|uniref:Transcriptional regulator n=1 Tax=Ureibacillus massiliensis 4400831 = CIP 108448 = CCUG 49529 TaxID=1211035 RepID=A0A0A3J697_9BACL|nr:LacI family DNA-binding transcriptional regulator [Ureibacillus massiliensis]KGR90688.1 transcriptional regulator [Ureibacillus massiliensis 4400831 = CIP 108448 = CCUG 49529]